MTKLSKYEVSKERMRKWKLKNPDYYKEYNKLGRSPIRNKKRLNMKCKMYNNGLIPNMSAEELQRIEDNKVLADMPKVFCWDEVCVIL